MRAETWPEGRDAVLRVQASGTEERGRAEYQVWNWVKGEGERERRERVERVNWEACCGGGGA